MRVVMAGLLLTMALFQGTALAAFGGQNGKIAFTRSHGPLGNTGTPHQIHTANPDGSGVTAITSVSPSRYPAWSPNGSRIAFARGNSLLTIDQNGGNQQTVLTWTNSVGAIEWSPEGARLVVELQVCDPQGACRFDIHTVNANGTGLTDVTPDVFDDRNPSWSPDGTLIAFDSSKGQGNQDIYTVLADGSGQVRLTTDASIDANPDWSPDGGKLVFESNRSFGRQDIWSMDANGADQFRVGPGGSDSAVDQDPVWSPNGDLILFARNSSAFVGCGYRALWTMEAIGENPIGENPIQITDPGDGCYDTDWSPDWQPLPGTYVRPKSASPVRVSLVPAYKPCTASNRTHGPPLASASCSPPVQQSDHVTLGTPDANQHPVNSVGYLKLTTIVGDPAQFGNQADVHFNFRLNDVRDKATGGTYASGKWLRVVLGLRMTDRMNGPAYRDNATVTDLEVAVDVLCHGGAPPNGAICSDSTTMNAVLPTVVREGNRAQWQIDQVKVYDGGADGDADTTGDNTLFAVQGIFVP